MKHICILFRLAVVIFAATASIRGTRSAVAASAPQGQESLQRPAPRTVDLKAADGAPLKATYFAAARPGPGVLLFHQVNRTRKSWDDVAVQLAAAGINTLTVDLRGFGESGGTPYDKLTHAQRNDQISNEGDPRDRETAWQYLVSQPGVERDVIGVGGAGLLGVGNSVQMARQHPAEVKSLALLSGETFREGLQYLQKTPQLPGLFVVDDKDEYPPTVEAMELAYISCSNPGKKFVHYSAAEEAPWVWYEPNDVGKVPASGGHGTDMFKPHPELPGIIVDWFVTTLIKTPGHAPADTVASAAILDEIRLPSGVERARRQLLAARQKDPKAQLWPEITASIIAQDHLRAGETRPAVEILELNLLAYPDSADAEGSLADAYLANSQKDLARHHAEKALALLDAHGARASSWTDTEEYRGEIRRDAQQILKKLGESKTNSGHPLYQQTKEMIMIRSCDLILCSFFVGLTLSASAQQSTPAAPAPPAPVGTLAGHPDWPAAKNPGDVDTVDHLVASLYDVVSGPAGQRDWDRFRALFLPDGRLGWVVPESAATKDKPARKGDAFLLSPDMFMQQNDPYFKTNGFFERSIGKRVEEFGNLVEVWSTKESRDAKDDAQPSSRGIDSFQIVHAHGRFWIASLIFDDERPGVTLPAKYLKTPGQ